MALNVGIEYDDLVFGDQPMSIEFHPTTDVIATGLITGRISISIYSAQGHQSIHQLDILQESCRDMKFDESGQFLYVASADKSLSAIDLNTGQVVARQENAHDASINCLKRLDTTTLVTGDDDGVVKLWDVRRRGSTQTFRENEDFISDMALARDGKLLLCTSGDGTLAVLNLVKGKLEAASDNQEDELLSIAIVKNGKKVVIGTQEGIIEIFKWDWWGDMKDRIVGHPNSIDAMVKLDEDTVLTGSSDGLIRIVQILPNKLLGVVGDHEEYPIERLAIDKTTCLLASCSHDNTVKFWDIGYLREMDGENDGELEEEDSSDEGEYPSTATTTSTPGAPPPPMRVQKVAAVPRPTRMDDMPTTADTDSEDDSDSDEDDSDSEEERRPAKGRGGKQQPQGQRKKKASFFDDM